MISQTFSELAVDISGARIVTERGAAIDSFYVRELDGGKIVSPERQLLIEAPVARQPSTACDVALVTLANLLPAAARSDRNGTASRSRWHNVAGLPRRSARAKAGVVQW